MKEIVAFHDAGRAVSSVIDLDQVYRQIVDAVARTFDVQLAALWLVVTEQTTASPESGSRPSAKDDASFARPQHALAVAMCRARSRPMSATPLTDALRRSPSRPRRSHSGSARPCGRRSSCMAPRRARPAHRDHRRACRSSARDRRRRRARGRARCRRARVFRCRSQPPHHVCRSSRRRRSRTRSCIKRCPRRE